jgi:hypothetical protein
VFEINPATLPEQNLNYTCMKNAYKLVILIQGFYNIAKPEIVGDRMVTAKD